MMNWLNTYSSAISALATLVTAIATIAIAVLTRGTVALYQLERGREHMKKGRLAGQLWRLSRHYETLAEILADAAMRDPLMTGHGQSVAKFIAEDSIIRRGYIERLLDEGAPVPMEVSANLDAALALTWGVEGLCEQIAGHPGGHVSVVPIREELQQKLLSIRQLIRTSYESIPVADRRWGPGRDDYETVLQRVFGPLAERDRQLRK